MRERVQQDLELLLQGSQPEGGKIVATSPVLTVPGTPSDSTEPDPIPGVASDLAALSQAQAAHDGEKRIDPRFPADELASMHPVSPLILDRSTVRVLNVSKHGLMIGTPDFLQVGIVIQIRLKNVFVLGEVRYCKPVDEGFHVGVQIQDLLPR